MAHIYAAHGMEVMGWESGDGPLNVGTIFSVTANNRIIAARYWKESQVNNGQTFTMSLYGAGDAPIAQASRVQLASDPLGWVQVNFPTPANVVPGTNYTIACRVPAANYFVTDQYPVLTGFNRDPFRMPVRFSTYDYSGGVAKPTGPGDYVYAIDAVAETAVATTPRSILALDSDEDNISQAWFNARAAEGIKMFVTAGTPWSVAGTETLNEPRMVIREQFDRALKAGLKIGLYTRDPRHWAAGLDAAGDYISQLQFFALDVESDPGIPVTQAMIDGVVARGARPLIYGGFWTWDGIQGSTKNDFSRYPLWDTNDNQGLDYNVWKSEPDYLSAPPAPYGGWNVPGNYRVGSQQKFDVIIDGVLTDLNSFDESWLIDTTPVTVSPDQTVDSWQAVTLTASGPGSWTQVGGTTQTTQISGGSLTFTAKPGMTTQTLIFEYGGKRVTVTVRPSQHGLVVSPSNITPVRVRRV